MSHWGSCLARLRECVRHLILDEVEEESMRLFENEDKVSVLCLAVEEDCIWVHQLTP